MNLNQTNESALPATVPQILSRLILLQQGRELPDPKSMEANEDHLRAEVTVRDRAAFDCWLAALGARRADIQTGASGPGVLTWVIAWDWHRKWRVSVQLTEAAVTPTALDADMMSGLEEVANGTPGPVEARVSDERVEEILAGLNGFVDREYDGGTHLVNGAAVPCAEVVGCDANLDKAVAWAEEQPDVEATSGPLLGEANMRLVDGTFIEWLSDEKSWAVTVSDDAEAVTR